MQRHPLNSTQALTITGLVPQRSVSDAIKMISRMTMCTASRRQTAQHATLPGNGNQQSQNHEKIIQLAGIYKLRAFHRLYHAVGFGSDLVYLSSWKGCQLDRLANDRFDKKRMAEPAHYFWICLYNPLIMPSFSYQLEGFFLLSEDKDDYRP